MSLKDRLKAKVCPVETVEVDGDSYLIQGKSKRDRGAVFAKCRKKSTGEIDSDRLESMLLTSCVYDPETSQPIFTEAEVKEWDNLPSSVTGPLLAHVMRVCGLDRQDLGPKDSDSTEN